jgi:hypothetical protein
VSAMVFVQSATIEDSGRIECGYCDWRTRPMRRRPYESERPVLHALVLSHFVTCPGRWMVESDPNPFPKLRLWRAALRALPISTPECPTPTPQNGVLPRSTFATPQADPKGAENGSVA